MYKSREMDSPVAIQSKTKKATIIGRLNDLEISLFFLELKRSR